mgnify:CR=1 FL=1
MKNGKHAAYGGMKRSLVLVVSLLALLLVVAGGTLAWLTAQDSVSNTFTPAHVTCDVEETFNGTAKSNVSIKNTSDIPVYIRASIIVTWKDSKGNVYGQLPVAGTDYTMDIAADGWVPNGGYYYYTSPVAVGATTGTLISSCTVKAGATPPGDDYKLSVEIIAEAIQSQPDRAVADAWNVTVSNGSLNVPTSGN